MSTIVVCRFHLTLQERNQDPTRTSSLPSFLITTFHDAMHYAVQEEFGNLHLDWSPRLGPSEEIEDRENLRLDTDTGIELREYPGAKGDTESTEMWSVPPGECRRPSDLLGIIKLLNFRGLDSNGAGLICFPAYLASCIWCRFGVRRDVFQVCYILPEVYAEKQRFLLHHFYHIATHVRYRGTATYPSRHRVNNAKLLMFQIQLFLIFVALL